jgi:hypothetical protein
MFTIWVVITPTDDHKPEHCPRRKKKRTVRTGTTAVADPYVKDYDAIEGEGPSRWAKRFDVSTWG